MKYIMVIVINKDIKNNKIIKDIVRVQSKYYQGLLDAQRNLDDEMYQRPVEPLDKEELNKFHNSILSDEKWIIGGRDIRILGTSKVGLENLKVYKEAIAYDNAILFPPCEIDKLPLMVRNMIKTGG